MTDDRKFHFKMIFFLTLLHSVICPLSSGIAECPEDDEDCRLRESGIIINRHVLDDPIYRHPATPLLADPSARSLSTSSPPALQKTKQPDKGKRKIDKPGRDLLIEVPPPAEETIQNTIQQNQALQSIDKEKSDTNIHKTIKYDLRLEFPVGMAQLDQSGQDALNQLGLMLQTKPDAHVNIYGYAEQAMENNHMRLAFDRVQQVKTYLNQVGIEPTRLHLYVIGESNNPPYDRVDIVIMKD